MKEINLHDIDDIALGASLLGAGGGGDCRCWLGLCSWAGLRR